YKKVIKNDKIDLNKISALLHARTEVFSDISSNVDFFEKLPDYDVNMYVHKKMKTNLDNSLISLKNSYEALENLQDWNEDSIRAALYGVIEKLGVKNGVVLWPVRTALSGKQYTPGGAIEIADVLGRDESLRRLHIGIEKLSNAK
ncbi:MAG TPA: glutamate--tRNA ligase, partial [Clostridiaceae bacterium]|nr:glutamate--tRNA ligase [Clostridiaceae bacterium]